MMTEAKKRAPQTFQTGVRKTLRISSRDLVKVTGLNDGGFPLLIEPSVEGVSLAAWIINQREQLEELLLRHAGILFRGFGVESVDAFEEVARAASPDLLDYRERAAPRTQVGAKVYTSTEYPAHQNIPLHHEMSYSHNWPTKIWFYCVQPAKEDGRTPITDDRRIFQRIDPEVRAEFMAKKVMYIRNFSEALDLPWQDAFQTNRKGEVEEYCRKWNIELEWRGEDGLRTRQVRQAVATHPKTGDTVWFNHAHMFHVSHLEPAVRAALLAQFPEDEIPRNACFGDGSPMDPEVLMGIRQIYETDAVRFDWQQGDMLLLDNFLAAHGRESFVGPRKIVVAMSDLYTNTEI